MSYHNTITINQQEIIQKGWLNPFELNGKTYKADLNTFALFDFLQYFANLDHKAGSKLKKNENGYIWINYSYIRDNNPMCAFTNRQYINKHLAILKHFGLIDIQKDKANNVYFKFGSEFQKDSNYDYTDTLLNSVEPTKPSQTQNNAPATPKTKYPHISEQKDDYTQSGLITNNLYNALPDYFEHISKDDFRGWLDYLKQAHNIKPNEYSALEHLKLLAQIGEKAKSAISHSIASGYKKPYMPKEEVSQGTNTQQSTHQKSKYYEPGEENEITRAGITLRYNPKLLNSKIGNNDYETEFWGIVKAWDLTSYELRSKYKDFGIDREIREYINEAIDQRVEFLKKKQAQPKPEKKPNYMDDLLA